MLDSCGALHFEIVGTVKDIRTIALVALSETIGVCEGRTAALWSKRKGRAIVRLADDTIRRAEIHWYEAHGFGRKEIKIKRWLED